jgi:organic hydroperoxide reductase OsmC/OhrA
VFLGPGLFREQRCPQSIGTLAKDSSGKMAITHCQLQPRIIFSGEKTADAAELARLHAKAHENCFIANSLRTEVSIS